MEFHESCNVRPDPYQCQPQRLGANCFAKGDVDDQRVAADPGKASVIRPNASWKRLLVGGMACYAASIELRLAVLSRVQVSVAYPMLSMGYVIAAVRGVIFWGKMWGSRERGKSF